MNIKQKILIFMTDFIFKHTQREKQIIITKNEIVVIF